jgi:hypothetical protein
MAYLSSYYDPIDRRSDEGRFEQDCQQNLDQLLLWKFSDNWNKLLELAYTGFREADKRNKGKRWPILSGRKKTAISKDLPQAVCILFAFAELYQQLQRQDEYGEQNEPFISTEKRIEFENVISELRMDVKWSFGPSGEVDIFTKCMVEVKKYIGTDITKTVRKKIVRKKTQSELSKRKKGAGFSSDDIKKRFIFNEAQAFFDGKDLGLPSGEAVSILERLLESFGEVVKHNKLDKNSNPSNASDILKGRIHTIKKALKQHKIPCRIESKRGVGYVLKKK